MTQRGPLGQVIAVCSGSGHSFSKRQETTIEIIAGSGVQGDVHSGPKIKHQSRVALDPYQPNLRQVHLIHAELLEDLDNKGFEVNPGDLGENITTRGIDLLAMGRDTLLRIGNEAVLSVTGLRNPCWQIDKFAPGLLNEVVEKVDGRIERKAGIMCIALHSGTVKPGDEIRIEVPEGPHIPLERV